MSKTIEQAAQRYQDEQELQQQKARDEEITRESKAGYTPISSFLTQRPRDPDGQPRRAGQTQPRNLAEIIGDENIFAILHQYFVHVLRCLGDRFGGLPLAGDKQQLVYQTTANEHDGLPDGKIPAKVGSDIIAALHVSDENEKVPPSRVGSESSQVGTPTPTPSTNATPVSLAMTNTSIVPTINERPSSKNSNTGSTRTVKRNSQCAEPVVVDIARPRQVAV